MWPFDNYLTLKRVIVNTKTDKAFRGVLYKKRRGYLVLKNAEMLKPKGETAPIDGELVIPSFNVDFMQVIG